MAIKLQLKKGEPVPEPINGKDALFVDNFNANNSVIIYEWIWATECWENDTFGILLHPGELLPMDAELVPNYFNKLI